MSSRASTSNASTSVAVSSAQTRSRLLWSIIGRSSAGTACSRRSNEDYTYRLTLTRN